MAWARERRRCDIRERREDKAPERDGGRGEGGGVLNHLSTGGGSGVRGGRHQREMGVEGRGGGVPSHLSTGGGSGGCGGLRADGRRHWQLHTGLTHLQEREGCEGGGGEGG